MEISEKLFDYLRDAETDMSLDEAKAILTGCKIIGVDLIVEDFTEHSPPNAMILYLERENGTRFQASCYAMEWDKDYGGYFGNALIVLGKSEFPEEVM